MLILGVGIFFSYIVQFRGILAKYQCDINKMYISFQSNTVFSIQNIIKRLYERYVSASL